MSLSDGVSFFDKSLSLFKDGVTAAASSNVAAQNLLLGSNPFFRWESIGSDDSTTETITLTFPESITISRIFLLEHNLKQFQITSNDANFTNVNSIDASGETGISETDFSRTTAYYEFDSVTIDDLTISMDKTQSVDAQKFINQIICTNEIGTLKGFPTINSVAIDRNLVRDKNITGKSVIEKGYETRSFDMRLVNYPYQEDLDILDSLHAREKSFLVWLCGGKPDNFKLKQRGWRISDVIPMQIDSQLQNGYEKNVYSLGATGIYSFEEVVS